MLTLLLSSVTAALSPQARVKRIYSRNGFIPMAPGELVASL